MGPITRRMATATAALAIVAGGVTASGALAGAASKPLAGSVAPKVKSTEPVGYAVVGSGNIDVPSGREAGGTVDCPSGTVVWSGGVSTSGEMGENLNGSYPDPTNSSIWRAWVNNSSSEDESFRVWVVCADQPSKYATEVSSLFPADADTVTNGIEACPKGTVVLGGGAAAGSAATTVNLGDSYPTTGGKKGRTSEWAASIDNDGPSTGLQVMAVCGKKPKSYSVLTGPPVDNASNSNGVAESPGCARGVVIGGGLTAFGILGVSMNETVPYGSDSWISFENNASGSDDSITPYGICAA